MCGLFRIIIGKYPYSISKYGLFYTKVFLISISCTVFYMELDALLNNFYSDYATIVIKQNLRIKVNKMET